MLLLGPFWLALVLFLHLREGSASALVARRLDLALRRPWVLAIWAGLVATAVLGSRSPTVSSSDYPAVKSLAPDDGARPRAGLRGPRAA